MFVLLVKSIGLFENIVLYFGQQGIFCENRRNFYNINSVYNEIFLNI